jgi:hypothetical protein
VTGVLLLIVILFFPGGILGSIINSDKISGAKLWSRISSIGEWVKKSR